jgi:hypothetical protein
MWFTFALFRERFCSVDEPTEVVREQPVSRSFPPTSVFLAVEKVGDMAWSCVQMKTLPTSHPPMSLCLRSALFKNDMIFVFTPDL